MPKKLTEKKISDITALLSGANKDGDSELNEVTEVTDRKKDINLLLMKHDSKNTEKLKKLDR